VAAPLGGIVRDGETIYVAAGNPGQGVQIYALPWPCGG
jgi:hypothetical protein